MLIWGLLCCCMGTVKNFGGLLVTRILLGFAEGAVFELATWIPLSTVSPSLHQLSPLHPRPTLQVVSSRVSR